MSVIVKLIIGGWISTFAMVGLCALNECGKLIRIHQRLGQRLRALAPAASLAPRRETPNAPAARANKRGAFYAETGEPHLWP